MCSQISHVSQSTFINLLCKNAAGGLTREIIITVIKIIRPGLLSYTEHEQTFTNWTPCVQSGFAVNNS